MNFSEWLPSGHAGCVFCLAAVFAFNFFIVVFFLALRFSIIRESKNFLVASETNHSLCPGIEAHLLCLSVGNFMLNVRRIEIK